MNNLEDFTYRIDGIVESPQVKRDYYRTDPIKHSDLRPSDPIKRPYGYRAYLISLVSDLYLIKIGDGYFPDLNGRIPYIIFYNKRSISPKPLIYRI